MLEATVPSLCGKGVGDVSENDLYFRIERNDSADVDYIRSLMACRLQRNHRSLTKSVID